MWVSPTITALAPKQHSEQRHLVVRLEVEILLPEFPLPPLPLQFPEECGLFPWGVPASQQHCWNDLQTLLSEQLVAMFAIAQHVQCTTASLFVLTRMPDKMASRPPLAPINAWQVTAEHRTTAGSSRNASAMCFRTRVNRLTLFSSLLNAIFPNAKLPRCTTSTLAVCKRMHETMTSMPSFVTMRACITHNPMPTMSTLIGTCICAAHMHTTTHSRCTRIQTPTVCQHPHFTEG
jgi:hypothetical protein